MSGAGQYEYRVRWRRQSRIVETFDKPFGSDRKVIERQEPERTYSAVYQTEQGAREKIKRLLDIDRNKDDYTEPDGHNPFDFPDLTSPPSLELRLVGEWTIEVAEAE